MTNTIRKIIFPALVLLPVAFFNAVQAGEDAIDANGDGSVSFQESQLAFGGECCSLSDETLAAVSGEALVERHNAVVDIWSASRSGTVDVNLDGRVTFREAQRAFREPCCRVDLVIFDQETHDSMIEQHLLRVDRWEEAMKSRIEVPGGI